MSAPGLVHYRSKEYTIGINSAATHPTLETSICRPGTLLLLAVLGGIPFYSGNEGHVPPELPVGSAGQQKPSAKLPTAPSAAGSLKPAHWVQETLS